MHHSTHHPDSSSCLDLIISWNRFQWHFCCDMNLSNDFQSSISNLFPIAVACDNERGVACRLMSLFIPSIWFDSKYNWLHHFYQTLHEIRDTVTWSSWAELVVDPNRSACGFAPLLFFRVISTTLGRKQWNVPDPDHAISIPFYAKVWPTRMTRSYWFSVLFLTACCCWSEEWTSSLFAASVGWLIGDLFLYIRILSHSCFSN